VDGDDDKLFQESGCGVGAFLVCHFPFLIVADYVCMASADHCADVTRQD
jgi:hypothetical protein